MRLQALKNVLAQLESVGDKPSIVGVAYRYMQLMDGTTATASSGKKITMTLATQEPAKDVEAKKAMLSAPPCQSCSCCIAESACQLLQRSRLADPALEYRSTGHVWQMSSRNDQIVRISG